MSNLTTALKHSPESTYTITNKIKRSIKQYNYDCSPAIAHSLDKESLKHKLSHRRSPAEEICALSTVTLLSSHALCLPLHVMISAGIFTKFLSQKPHQLTHTHRHISQHPRGQLSRQCDGVALSSCQAQRPGSFSHQKLQCHKTHSAEIAAMDMLIRSSQLYIPAAYTWYQRLCNATPETKAMGVLTVPPTAGVGSPT